MSENKQDKKQYQSQNTKPTIPQVSKAINDSAREKMKIKKSGTSGIEGL